VSDIALRAVILAIAPACIMAVTFRLLREMQPHA